MKKKTEDIIVHTVLIVLAVLWIGCLVWYVASGYEFNRFQEFLMLLYITHIAFERLFDEW